MRKFLLCAAIFTVSFANASTFEKADMGKLKGAKLKSLQHSILPDGRPAVVLGFEPSSDGFSPREFDRNVNVGIRQSGPTRSVEDSDMIFTFAGDPYSALNYSGLAEGSQVVQAIYMNDWFAKRFAGNDIVNVMYYNGANNNNVNGITTSTLSIAADKDNLIADPLYSEVFDNISSKAYSVADLNLKTPYRIKENEPIWIGYTVQPTDNDHFIVVDYIPTSDTNGGWVGFLQPGAPGIEWQNISSNYGSLTIYVTIAGDNLPKNEADIYGVELQKRFEPGVAGKMKLQIVNTASNPIKSFGYTYKIGNAEPVDGTIDFGNSELPYRYYATVTIGGITTEEVGLDIPFEIKITEVNGVPNNVEDATVNLITNSFPAADGFDYKLLIEEGTGTWCGYCPVGITMMEMAKEANPDLFVCAALHYSNGLQYKDQMNVSSTSSMSYYFNSYPTAMVNRWELLHPLYIIEDMEELTETYSKEKGLAGFTSLYAEYDSKNKIKINADVAFALDLPAADNRFRLAFYIVESGVGPYNQTNYYSGEQGQTYGWSEQPNPVKLMFDDVVRLMIGNRAGVSNSLPSAIIKGESYSYGTVASISAVKGEEFSIIGLIVDNKTGHVANSTIIPVTKTEVSGIGTTSLDGNSVKAVEGGILIEGEGGKADIYGLDGKVVASVSAGGFVGLPEGLYIVRTEGRSTKVLVK